MLLAFMSNSFWVAPALAATLNQTIQFMGTTPETLYAAFLSAKEHGAMTADGTRPATFYRRAPPSPQAGVKAAAQ